MNSLKSKVVWVTGASSGIGLACTMMFAKHGCRIVIGARRVEKLEQLAEQARAAGNAEIICLPLDVQDQASVDQFRLAAAEKWGAPDILLNNAGLVLGTDHIAEGKISDWQTIFDTNVMGVLRMTKAALELMKPACQGHIIFIGSISGHQVYEGGGPYCASKHSIKAINQTLKLELNGTGIRLSSIDPGMVETEFSIVRLGSKEKADKVYEGLTPLSAEDIAENVEFVATRPAHVNIDNIVVMPTDQASVYKAYRR